MTDKEKEPKALGYFARLIDEIRKRGLPVPAALVGEARPLALSTRQDLQPWGELHGYDTEALQTLTRIVKMHVRSKPYLEAVASDLSERVDLDGAVAGPVSEADRHSAALVLYTRGLRDAAKSAPKPNAPVMSVPAPSPAPSPASAPIAGPKPPAPLS